MTMELQNAYYNYMLKGTKRIEQRLYDEKRKNIIIGDIITVTNAQTNEEFEVKVVGLLHYETFDDLFLDYDIEVLADKSMTIEEIDYYRLWFNTYGLCWVCCPNCYHSSEFRDSRCIIC